MVNKILNIAELKEKAQGQISVQEGISDDYCPIYSELTTDGIIIGTSSIKIETYSVDDGKTSYDNNQLVCGGDVQVQDEPTGEYVDLDLPSGLKWAKCNVGATSETEYGKYFQWGDVVGYTDEAEVKARSIWATAPFNNGSSDYDETYFASVRGTVCPNDVLTNEYDAASVNMGGNWRMPTKEDFEELTANTDSSWEEDFNGSGVNGRKFTSKVDSTKYIFIPAAGYANLGSLVNPGGYGIVWGSLLNSSTPTVAWGLVFLSGGMGVTYSTRNWGCPVRGVRG